MEVYDPSKPEFSVVVTTPEAERSLEVAALARLFSVISKSLDGVEIEMPQACEWIETLTSPDIYDDGIGEYLFKKCGVLVSSDEEGNFLHFEGPLNVFASLIDLVESLGSEYSWCFSERRFAFILEERPRLDQRRAIQMTSVHQSPDLAQHALAILAPVVGDLLRCYWCWPGDVEYRWSQSLTPWVREVVALAKVEHSNLVFLLDPVLPDVGSWIQTASPRLVWDCRLLAAVSGDPGYWPTFFPTHAKPPSADESS